MDYCFIYVFGRSVVTAVQGPVSDVLDVGQNQVVLIPSSSGVNLSQGFLKPFVPNSCSCAGTVALRWSLGDSSSHPSFNFLFFPPMGT